MESGNNFCELNGKDTFVATEDTDIEQLLKDSKSLNTQKSMATAITRLNAYLNVCKLPNLDDIADDALPEIIT